MKRLIVKNLNQLKKQVKPGMVIESRNVLKNTDEQREIIKVNTVSIISKEYDNASGFYKHKIDPQGRSYYEYFTDFDKARYMKFHTNGDIDFLAHEKNVYGHTIMAPYGFSKGETWLTIKIFTN